jgi:hypothetical protein
MIKLWTSWGRAVLSSGKARYPARLGKLAKLSKQVWLILQDFHLVMSKKSDSEGWFKLLLERVSKKKSWSLTLKY